MKPPRMGIPAIECGVKPPRIPIPPMEPPCPPIAVAVEAAKTHAATQPRRMNFFAFITLFPSKEGKPTASESCDAGKDKRKRSCYDSDAAPMPDRLMISRDRIPDYKFGRTCPTRASNHVAWL